MKPELIAMTVVTKTVVHDDHGGVRMVVVAPFMAMTARSVKGRRNRP